MIRVNDLLRYLLFGLCAFAVASLANYCTPSESDQFVRYLQERERETRSRIAELETQIEQREQRIGNLEASRDSAVASLERLGAHELARKFSEINP